MRAYATPATRGSKEGKRRAALDRRERVEAYCLRHQLDMPTTSEGVQAILAASLAEATDAIRAHCAALKSANVA